nr:hypothetical protein [Tanacetum cinerariifolium]
MDLFGPTFVKSLNKKSYCLFITDDYSRFTWVFLLSTKDETSPILKTFITGLENQLCLKVKVIRSDNGTKFKNSDLNQFYRIKGIKREFSVPRTPQQNGIAERKNRTLIEAARTMLTDTLLPIPFWAKAVNTAFYVQNRVLVTKPYNKTLYELLHGRTPSISFMRPFGCHVTILNTLDPLGKFEEKVDEGFLVGYSVSSKAFRVFNSRTRIVHETLHVNFLENKPNLAGSGPTWLFDIDSLTRTMNYQPVIAGNQTNPSTGFQDKIYADKAGEEIDQQYVLFPMWSSGFTNPQNNDEDAAFDGKEHDFDVKKPKSEVILTPSSSAQSWKQDDKTKKEAKGKSLVESVTGYRDLNAEIEDCSDNSSNEVNAAGSIVLIVRQNSLNSTNTFSVAGPSNADNWTYSDDENDVGAEADFNNLENSITEELLQFKMQKVWVLVDLPHGKRAIGTKWVYMNKKDERGIVIKNKARLVAQGHTQEEGIDYEDVFSPVARIEAIRLFLAYASFMDFMVYQMNIKSAFLYGTIKEEVFICQPSGFKDPDHLDKVYKVVKALYGLHQAPRAWYETLATYLLSNDDIIFGTTNKDLCKSFEKLMKDGFQMSSTGELTFFLGLQKDPDGEDVDVHTYRSMIGSLMYLTSSRPYIVFAVCVCARFQVTPKASHLHAVKKIFRYLKGKPHLGLWYPKVSPFDLVAYSNSDYAGASLDKKSTTEGCQFLGCRLISWKCKKQTIVATSSTEAEYVVAASCCTQVLWIQNQLLDYGLVRNVDSLSKFYMYPCFIQLLIRNQLGFSKVETPLFEGMIVEQVIKEGGAEEKHVEEDTTAQGDDAQEPCIPSPTPPTPPPQPPHDLPSSSQGRMIDEMDKDDVVALMDDKEEEKKEEEAKVVEDDQEDEPAEVQEVVHVVTTAKLITKVVTAVSEIVAAASTIISAAEPQVLASTIIAALVRVAAASTRRRK